MPITPTPGPRKVLVVDDAATVAETLAMILMKHGHETRIARSAEEAVETIAVWEPEVAILDVMLPGVNGIEFAKVLKGAFPSCVIVLISGHPGAAGLLEFAANEGNAFPIFPKPLEPATIVAIVAGAAKPDQGGAEA